MTWDYFIPPRSWYDDSYTELRFEKYTPGADGLIGKKITKEIADKYNLSSETIGKIVESVSYPNG